MMKRTILTLVALLSMVAQFSYGQKELSIKEMEDSMALGNLNIQVDLATEYITGERVKQDLSKAYSLIPLIGIWANRSVGINVRLIRETLWHD